MKKTVLLEISYDKEERWYSACIEDMGICTQGKNIDELITMIRDAIKLYYNDDNKEGIEVNIEKSVIKKGKKQNFTLFVE